MIKGILIVNNHGKPRIVKFYEHVPDAEQQAVIRDIYTQVSKRPDTLCNFLEGTSSTGTMRLSTLSLQWTNRRAIWIHYALDEIVMGGMVLETNINEVLTAVNEMNRLDSLSSRRSLTQSAIKK
uniref:AP complex mu/sigma subunit domain-containing protein n=1 Tax=Hyaloperonospora arabidopsidis (strain Emoy2) TaxID=559515 RepID=M4BD68_HYAAE